MKSNLVSRSYFLSIELSFLSRHTWKTVGLFLQNKDGAKNAVRSSPAETHKETGVFGEGCVGECTNSTGADTGDGFHLLCCW